MVTSRSARSLIVEALGHGGKPLPPAARRHENDAATGSVDDEHRRAAAWLRPVHRPHLDPAVRPGPGLDRLRLRRSGRAMARASTVLVSEIPVVMMATRGGNCRRSPAVIAVAVS